MNILSNSGHAQQLLISVRSSLWFVPTLVIVSMIALAFGLVELDQHFGQELRRWWPRLFVVEAEGARSMLSAIATSMATVAGVVFSITIVALALASSQYTSRVLRNFMRDPVNQVMLGIFIGVYLYCLLVLRTISNGNEASIPSIAILGSLVLAIFSSGFFIFFIHHISSTIQASEMAASITRETIEAIDLLFPDEIGNEASETSRLDIPAATIWHSIPASTMGYVQSVRTEALLKFAREHKTIVRMECGIGDFVVPDRPLASLALGDPPSKDMIKALNGIYAIDTYRTIDQDAAFGIRQLVDISLKALSPGINDTTTAVTCIEHLSAILARCARRGMAPPHRFDGDVLRVIAQRPDFNDLVSLAFNQILENAEGNTEIVLRMLAAIELIGQSTGNEARITALKRQTNIIEEVSGRSAKSSVARKAIEDRLEDVRQSLERQPVAVPLH